MASGRRQAELVAAALARRRAERKPARLATGGLKEAASGKTTLTGNGSTRPAHCARDVEVPR